MKIKQINDGACYDVTAMTTKTTSKTQHQIITHKIRSQFTFVDGKILLLIFFLVQKKYKPLTHTVCKKFIFIFCLCFLFKTSNARLKQNK